MKCLNCGKELEWSFEFELGKRHNIGYDCECGYTSYEQYIENTQIELLNTDDFYNSIMKWGGEVAWIGELITFEIDAHTFFVEILPACDFRYVLVIQVDEEKVYGTIRSNV